MRAVARRALRMMQRAGAVLCLCPQNLIELWGVSTRPKEANGLGLGRAQAIRNLSRCETYFRHLPDRPEAFAEWKRLVVTYDVSGLKVHDARLVAAMKVHGISGILTFDTGDFKRYGKEIEVIHPSTLDPDKPVSI